MRRLWFLPIAAAVIVGVCWYKLAQTHAPPTGRVIEQLCPAAPFRFSLPDQNKPTRYINLRAYLGRHHVILVFFDGAQGAETDPVLLRLRRDHDELNRRGVKVFGVSTNLPQKNRPPKTPAHKLPGQPREPFPFPLLSDLEASRVHKLWGRYDAASKSPLTGTFHIDAAGNVRCDGRKPLPVDDPDAVIDTLIQ